MSKSAHQVEPTSIITECGIEGKLSHVFRSLFCLDPNTSIWQRRNMQLKTLRPWRQAGSTYSRSTARTTQGRGRGKKFDPHDTWRVITLSDGSCSLIKFVPPAKVLEKYKSLVETNHSNTGVHTRNIGCGNIKVH